MSRVRQAGRSLNILVNHLSNVKATESFLMLEFNILFSVARYTLPLMVCYSVGTQMHSSEEPDTETDVGDRLHL